MTDHATCPNCEEYDGLTCEYHSSDYSKGMPPEETVTSVWECSKCNSVIFVSTPKKK